MNTPLFAGSGVINHSSVRKRRFGAVATPLRDESGAATAEFAIVTLAAVGFASLLMVVLRGDDIKGMLTDIIHRALSISI
jgi:Flp pilus assembly pilin Flp